MAKENEAAFAVPGAPRFLEYLDNLQLLQFGSTRILHRNLVQQYRPIPNIDWSWSERQELYLAAKTEPHAEPHSAEPANRGSYA